MSRASLIACASAAVLAAALGVSAHATASSGSPPPICPAPSDSAHAPVPRGFVGVVVDEPVWPDPFVNIAQQLDVMVASGVQTIRVVFDWSLAQPYKSWSQVPANESSEFTDVGGVPTNFTEMDQLVDLAAARGLTVLPTILNAPSWDGKSYPDGTVELPKSDKPFAAFAAALVHRYGPKGTFWSIYGPKDPIEEWQIWNEPDVPAFWPQQPFASSYLALLRAAHDAIKSADPSAKVVLAGLANYSWEDLETLYSYRGARKLFDVVAVHPYTKAPSGVITILCDVRKVMEQNGDARKPMLADEISWPSSKGHTTHDTGCGCTTTESGQARNIGQLLPMLVKDRVQLGLAGFDYYDWAGLGRDNKLAFEFAGLFRLFDGTFQAKPAYSVFKRDALAMEGCRAKGSQATDCLK